LTLSPILPGMSVPGKQHPRTRTAWELEELPVIQETAANAGLVVDRWRIHTPRDPIPQGDNRGYDLAEEFSDDDRTNIRNASWALAQVAAGRGRQLFAYPLRDLDRTMDLHHGVLDTLCNPRVTFGALRLLNAVLFAPGNGLRPASNLSRTRHGWELGGTEGSSYEFIDTSQSRKNIVTTPRDRPPIISVYNLLEGTVQTAKREQLATVIEEGCFLVVSRER
jgi:hypothetical protein